MSDKELLTLIFSSSKIKVSAPTEQDTYLAKASLEQVKEFLPTDIDLTKNPDLLGIATTGFVVNRANKNGDCLGTKETLSCLETVKGKPLNASHLRGKTFGFITGYAFSEYGTDKPLTEKEVRKLDTPFNVVISGYVWRVVNPELCEALEDCADPDSDNYGLISSSWELGFREWVIAKGSKNLNECEIISDPAEIEKQKSMLKVFGGTGKTEDDKVIFRKVVGNVLFMGFGFTENPAADVKGVAVSTPIQNDDDEDSKAKEIISKLSTVDDHLTVNIKELCATLNDSVALDKFLNNLKEKSSQTQNADVKEISMSKKNIKITKLDEINDELLLEATASSIRDFISDEISKESKKWETEKATKENEVKAANEKIVALEKEVEASKTKVSTVESDLEKLKNAEAARVQDENFQVRMAGLDEVFTLNDEERKIVAEDIKDLDEEAFAKYLKKFEVLASAKKKVAKKEEAKATEEDKKLLESKAAEEALEKAEAEKAKLPNAGSDAGTPNLTERMGKAFAMDQFEISTNKRGNK